MTENLANKQTFKYYIIFWIGQLISILGSSISQFVIIWWITEITGSTILLSLTSFLYVLPMTVMVTLTGVVIDRWNRKTIIVIADSLQAYIMLIVVILFNFGVREPILIILIMSLLGIFQGFHIPTVSAIVPTMVPKDKLSRMNGVNFLFRGFIQILGPILSAMFLSFLPLEIILWIDPITFIFALIPLLLVKIPKVNGEVHVIKKNSFFKDFKIGFQTLKLIPIVFMMLLISMFINFLLLPTSIFMPYFILYNHSGNATNLAFVLAFMNGGSLFGAFITAIKKEWKHGTLIYFGGEFILMLVMGIVALTPYRLFLMMAIAFFIFGLTIPIINTIYLTIMQLKVPADKMGRISSIDWALSMAITPIGTLIVGPLAELIGVPSVFLYYSIIGMIITVILYWFTLTRIKNNKQIKLTEKIAQIVESPLKD